MWKRGVWEGSTRTKWSEGKGKRRGGGREGESGSPFYDFFNFRFGLKMAQSVVPRDRRQWAPCFAIFLILSFG